MKKVLIMAGGTGGHVIPALTVAKELIKNTVKVEWLGTPRGIENDLVPSENIKLHHISITGLRGANKLSLLFAPIKLLRALWQAIRLVKKINPDVVLGMGGFASGPGGLAAWLLRKKLVIHEQNAAPGLTNRSLAKIANQVLSAFPDTFPNRKDSVVVGNPVASNIRFNKKNTDSLQILIVGGSQGATKLNETMLEVISLMQDKMPYKIWHITGKKDQDKITAAYQRLNVKARVDAFVKDMHEAYAFANVAFCRAGALTVSELAAAAVPSILVPYPYAADDHQTKNAEFLSDKNAAILIQQRDLQAQNLLDILLLLNQDREKLLAMSLAAQQLSRPNATTEVINRLVL